MFISNRELQHMKEKMSALEYEIITLKERINKSNIDQIDWHNRSSHSSYDPLFPKYMEKIDLLFEKYGLSIKEIPQNKILIRNKKKEIN